MNYVLDPHNPTRTEKRKIINGLKFLTRKGRMIPPDSNLNGPFGEEHYPGYVLSYATGRSGGLLDPLQFYWISEQ